MSVLVVNLILIGCMYLVLPIEYVLLRNNAVYKNGLILSVTLPPEAAQDSEIQAYCSRYRKGLFRLCAVLSVVLLPCVFLPWVSVVLTISMLWLLVMMALMFRYYGRAFQGLREIKSAKGWCSPAAGQTVVELRPLQLPRRLRLGWFVPPMLLSVLPAISVVGGAGDAAWNTLLIGTSAIGLMVTGLSLLTHGLIFRQRPDVLDNDLELTSARTRVRRYNWSKCWLLLSWTTAGYSLAVWLCQGSMAWYLVWTMVYAVVVIAASVATELAARRAQQRLSSCQAGMPQVDEDDYWIWGQFYYNPNSRNLMVNERVGMGMSVNYAHPAGKVLAVLLVLMLLAMPVFGGVLMVEEFSPITVELTEQALEVTQGFTEYTILRSEIVEVRVLEAMPNAARLWGTGMETLLKGSFSVDGVGTAKLCLNPTQAPFLMVKTAGETYLLGSADTEGIFQALAQ